MNQNLGLIGKKLGCTQVFGSDGTMHNVTVLEAGPCVVVEKRTEERHGYSALRLAFGERKAKHVRKPNAGEHKKLGLEKSPAVVREFRVPAEIAAKFEVGQTLTASDVFEEGQTVDVTGISKGRGFTGVMKRHNFKGARSDSHGTHEYRRHGGSIGQNMTPGRTFPNMGMPGRYGGVRSTVLSLRVAKVLAEEGLVLVEGGVPGPNRGVVAIRGAVKGKPKASS